MKDVIAGVLNGILEEANAESLAAFEAVSASAVYLDLAQHIEDRLPDRFSLSNYNGPLRLVEGLLIKALGANSRARFLFQHADFVQSHVRKLIEGAEGYQCGVDKTRTILRLLARHLIDGDPIAFDYSGEFTYHLPVKTLISEAEVIGYFNALQRLYYGDPVPYIRHLAVYGLVGESGAT